MQPLYHLELRLAPARKLKALRADFFAGVRSLEPGLPALAGLLAFVAGVARSAENALIEGLAPLRRELLRPVSSRAVVLLAVLAAVLRVAFLPCAANFFGVCGSLALRLTRGSLGTAMPAATEYNPFLPGRYRIRVLPR